MTEGGLIDDELGGGVIKQRVTVRANLGHRMLIRPRRWQATKFARSANANMSRSRCSPPISTYRAIWCRIGSAV